MSPRDLPGRFADHLRESGVLGDDRRLVVAVSGGLDSVVLLHLLRFGDHGFDLDLLVGHIDHRMRPGSGADAAWVRGLARAWRLPCEVRTPGSAPEGEAGARSVRYRLLEEIRREGGADVVVTAHHADDQAETVLFRVLRGTGVRGLVGIRPRRDPTLVRPLLPFFREELEAYARAHRIAHRVDPTNEAAGYARNVIRHRLLPEAEERVAPGARTALARLARLAREEEAGWRSLLEPIVEEVVAGVEEGRISVDRARFRSYHPHVGSRILRTLLRRFGTTLDEAGTRAALEFINSGASGGEIELPGGVRVAREFDRIVLREGPAPGEVGEDRALRIEAPDAGSGEFLVGGRRLRAAWAPDAPPPGRWREEFDPRDVRFPLTLRSWEPGDRLSLPFGSKKLKKIFGEHRIPKSRRGRIPVLADAEGRLLWVVGIVRSEAGRPGEGGPSLYVSVTDVDGS